MADVGNSDAVSVPAFAVTAAVGAVIILIMLVCNVGKGNKQKSESEEKENEEKTTKNEKTEKHGKKTKAQKMVKKSHSVQFSHPWLACNLKGHSGRILSMDLSPNGKYLITASDDRTVMIWNTKEFSQKEHKSVRGNVEYDHATRVKYSPDSKAFVCSLSNENTVRIFRIGKKDTGGIGNITAAFDFEKKHSADIIYIGIASNGKFIMTCSSDTTIMIWSIKGDVFDSIDTRQMNNSFGAVSPCGRFIASSGFTPDVKVWEVGFDKAGNYTGCKRAFELKGHSAGVYSFSFNGDSSRMVSVSKDRTWKYWNTDIRYDMGQDPYLLKTGSIEFTSPCLVALSPDGRSVAIANESTISVHNAISGEQEEKMSNVFSGEVTDLSFDLTNKYILCSGDRHVSVFNNVTGYRASVDDLLEKVKSANTQAQKERIRQQISDAQEALNNILGQSNGHAGGQKA
ncbi:transducin beta-like protein 2 [Ostrea edulis]|uniref:transducin beta-like protein 2 n=1 Tax=Ostrea edulis TaxID=37623 RepID=UPI0024AEF8C4|nr:transducin beta-like protein 2 [Ostrea edulis]